MKKAPILLAAILTGCATPARHKHIVPEAEYLLPCIIENVRIEVYQDDAAANKRCAVNGKATTADDGKPIGDEWIISGCFHPNITIGDNDTFKISGTLVIQPNREIMADELEHLIWNACKKGEQDGKN